MQQQQQQMQMILRRGGKNTQKNYTKTIFMTQIVVMVWSLTYLEPDILEWKVKWALGSITTNKASGGDGIPVELFQILKDDAVKVLHSICQQIWVAQQWPQDWKRSVFIPIPKKGNAKECLNCCTVALISHASKVMLKILQARLQQYMNCELPHVHVGFRKGRDQIATICWIIDKSKRVPEKHLFLLYWLCQSLWLCGSQQTVENSSRDRNTRSPCLPPENCSPRSLQTVMHLDLTTHRAGLFTELNDMFHLNNGS